MFLVVMVNCDFFPVEVGTYTEKVTVKIVVTATLCTS